MEEKNRQSSRIRHQDWRRIAKRERRRRLRRKAAQVRDLDEERLRATLESTAEYSNWIAEQTRIERERELAEEKEHKEREKLWLEEEVRAQKEWRIVQERRAKLREEQLRQEEIIRKEFEAKQEALRAKREDAKRQQEEEMRKHQDIRKDIDDYIDQGAATPEFLRVVSESQSGKDPCPFFAKTGACRYGDICSRNHRRPALSKFILVPGFYTHFSLEKNSAEYDTDISLEFEGSETRKDFREFYESVVPELESFGRIKTLKVCRNAEIHLRGNLYVEYYTEREAARAWRKLKGRYYAQRQLNCEFVNITSWRNAVCGMAKCPKGRACNFLHTFRNPNDEYDIKSPPRRAKKNGEPESSSSRRSEHRSKFKWDDWDRASVDEGRNWRWSESPEPENRCKNRDRSSRASIDEQRGDDYRRYSRSDRKRTDDDDDDDDEDIESSSRSSRRRDARKRDESTRRSRRKEDACSREENSRSREERSRKRHAGSRSDEEATRRRSDVKKSKKSKNNNRRVDGLRGEREVSRKQSRSKVKNERREPDENVDTNTSESRRRTSNDIERIIDEEKSNNGVVEHDDRSTAPSHVRTNFPPSAD